MSTDVAVNQRKPCILVIGQAGPARGFSRVLRSLFEPLKDRYEIHQFGYDCFEGWTDFGWRVHPNQNRSDFYGTAQIGPLINKLRPHVIFLLNDLWKIPIYLEVLKQYRGQSKTVAYCPLEGPIRNREIIERLAGVDRLVVYNRFAKKAIDNCFDAMRGSHSEYAFPKIDIIPHGVDTKTFYACPDDIHRFSDERRIKARQFLFSTEPQDPESFIVLNANRNQPRKRIDITVRGFSIFAQGKPKHVKLYLHTEIKAPQSDLWHLAKNHGIADRLITTGAPEGHPSVTDDELNLIYNACDVGINTSTGEGWGLVSFEHAATGAAQVVPRHSACEELWEGSAVMLDATDGCNRSNLAFHQKLVSDEAVANALERLYQDHDYRKEMSIAAYENATGAQYHWESIAQRWTNLFDDLLSEE